MTNHIIDQNWSHYSPDEHARWRELFQRQENVIKGRVVSEFTQGLEDLKIAADGIPHFEDLSELLMKKTGWEVVAVPGLVPDDVFFRLLAQRKFPSTTFIRERHQMDYLQEPDIFHDIFGHVPLLVNPVFAQYMEYYGQEGLKALNTGHLHNLARLYWYTVEFGLIQTPEGLRTYGAGIVSSYAETIYCLEDPRPLRMAFDIERVMRTNYRIDDFQEIYFVIESFVDLFQKSQQDLTPLYDRIKTLTDFAPRDVIESDRLIGI